MGLKMKNRSDLLVWHKPEEWDTLVNGQYVFRGFSKNTSNLPATISSPQHRQPVNMPLAVQSEMDDWFEDVFGIRYRQRAIFVTGDFNCAASYAGTYGVVGKIRALAPFAFCWSPICTDLYVEYQQMPSNETLVRFLSRQNFTDMDLAQALKSGNEIMLVGSSFAVERGI